MSEYKSAQVHDLDLKPDGSVTVAFAKLGAVDEDEDYTFPSGVFPAGKNVPLGAYSHNSWPQRGGLMPTGKGQIREDGEWAIFDGKFFLKTTHGTDAYETVREMGDEQQWSYGYDVLKTAAVPAGLKAKRGLASVDVHEVCPTLMGAQPLAHTAGIKGWREQLDESIAAIEDDEDLADMAETLKTLKDALPAGESFADASARVLRDVDTFTARANAINAIRLKEGRAISTARRGLLEAHLTSLRAGVNALEEMLVAATPKTSEEDEALASAKARRARAEAELAIASSGYAH